MNYKSPLFVNDLDSKMSCKINQVREANPGLGDRLADYYGSKATIAFYPEIFLKSGIPEEEVNMLTGKFSDFVEKILGNGINEITYMFNDNIPPLMGTEENALYIDEKMGL
ncbi:MAG: hypothetical protein PHN31_01115 [Candidatus Gracilibacteria bacterium]|nr:hypothetical protein [Candidatus Gracilibacteria bacterium]